MDNKEKRIKFLQEMKYDEDKLTQEDLMGLQIVQAKREKEKRDELVRQGTKLFASRERKEEAARKAEEQRHKKEKSQKRIKVGAWVLAGLVAIGAASYIAYDKYQDYQYKEQEKIEMQETGRGMAEAGLSEKTMQALEEYDTLFAQDSEQEISEEDLLNKISGMKELAVDVMKERMANITQTDIENITYDSHYDREEFHGSITVEEGNYGKETTYRIRGLASEGPHLSAEYRRVLQDLSGKYENLSSDLKAGEITKQKAMNELKKMYPDIKELAEANLLIDRDGNVVSVDFEQQKDTSKDDGFEVGE